MKSYHLSIRWRQWAGAAALACVLAAGRAWANGTGPTVVAGQAGFSTVGSSLNITNSPGAIINWQGFSIGAGETTRFIQQSAASSVLNRVTGSDPSVILGALTSNGRVFLINPSGILVGAGARIDVAGLVASTLNLSNQDFLAGRLNFTPTAPAGIVENRGAITTPSGGSVYLVGSNVVNSGIINSPQGDVILAAGRSVKIFDSSTPGVRVEITAGDNTAVNLGEILAQSGEIGIYGAALRNAGIINADQVVRDASGKITLRAKQDVTIEAGSRISANGEQGGGITVQSETGTTLVSGSIEARGTGDTAGTGGTVHLLGNHVGLSAASVDVSGTTGGGTVLVGGNFHGAGPEQNASTTTIDPNSGINADAINSGSGGRIAVWSDGATRVAGAFSARGGTHSGDGGFIETSGTQLNVADGTTVNTTAPRGTSGMWLLDPATDFDIGSSIAGATVSNNLATTDQTFSATRDIIVSDPITWTSTHSLTLNADRDVLVHAAITGTGGTVNLIADHDGTGPGLAGGTVTFTSSGFVTVDNVSIRFNPVAYTTTDAEIAVYRGFVVTNPVNTLDARAWTFIDNASATAQGKTYDATTTATLNTPFTFLNGPDGSAGQAVSLSAGAAAFNSKDVATAATVNFTGYGLGGGDAGSYALFSQPASQAATVTAKALTMSGLTVAASKTYDATLVATVGGTAALATAEAPGTGTTADGKAYTSDTVNFTGTAIGTYNSKDVATAGTVTFGGLALNNSNYSLTIQGPAAATITEKALTMSGLTVAASKTYDATLVATVGGAAALAAAEAPGTGTTADGKAYTGDTVNFTGTAIGTYNSKDVATAGTVTYGGLALNNSNYSLTIQSPAAATIMAKALTMSGLTVAASKTYDATLVAAVGGAAALATAEAPGSGTTADGTAYTGDTVNFTGTATGAYNSKDVATATTVTYGGLSLNNSNYSLTIQSPAAATITAKALTMGGLTVAASKTYDATLTAAVGGTAALATAEAPGTGTTADGTAYTGDTVAITGTAIGTYNSKDVATATTVTFGGLSLTGAQSGNYSLTTQNNAAATITPAPLGITANSATRLYGDADPLFSAIYTGFLNGETTTALTGALSLTTSAVPTSNVGVYPITPSGQGSSNYTISYVNGSLGVTPAPLGIAANSTNKTYGNTISFTGSEFSSTGLKNGETVGSVSLASSGAAATAGVAGGPYDIMASAATGGTFTPGNYTISYVDGSLGVTPAPLGITANSASRLYGDANPLFSATYTGLRNGETAASLTGALSLTTSAVPTSNVGSYAIIPSGQGSANYAITYVNGTLGVTPVSLTVTADARSKVYGTNDPALTYSVAGLVNNPALGVVDTTDSVFSGALTRVNGETVSGGPYAITQGTLAANSNYTLGGFTGNALAITPAALTVAANPQSKLFGTSDPALTYSITGLVNNPSLGIADTAATVLSGTLTRVPGESALGGPYAITQGSLTANSNYALGVTRNTLVITGAAAEPVLGFNAGQVIFAGVIDNEFYYRPGNFWHISLNPNNADPGFDVMRGTNDLNARLNKSSNSCDSVSGGGYCETWTFPQQFEKTDGN